MIYNNQYKCNYYRIAILCHRTLTNLVPGILSLTLHCRMNLRRQEQFPQGFRLEIFGLLQLLNEPVHRKEDNAEDNFQKKIIN